MKTIMAFGTFDILHPGHLAYLSFAKRHGDYLIVVVARDKSVKMMKGRDTVMGEKDRLRMVKALHIVDRAVLGNRMRKPSDRYRIIRRFQPDILVFGYDQELDLGQLEGWLKGNGIKADIVKMKKAVGRNRYKSSKIRRKIAVWI